MDEITKQEAQEFLSNAFAEYAFWCHDGQIINNIKELRGALSAMTNITYRYHANSMKNDFSNWVQDIVGDQKLADNLRNAKNRSKALTIIKYRVALYESLLKNKKNNHA